LVVSVVAVDDEVGVEEVSEGVAVGGEGEHEVGVMFERAAEHGGGGRRGGVVEVRGELVADDGGGQGAVADAAEGESQGEAEAFAVGEAEDGTGEDVCLREAGPGEQGQDGFGRQSGEEGDDRAR
jgi:hypothetical protein